jgi:hypothetical protein
MASNKWERVAAMGRKVHSENCKQRRLANAQ